MKAFLVALLVSQTATSTSVVDRKLFDAVAIEAVKAQRLVKDARAELETCKETALIVKDGADLRTNLATVEDAAQDVQEIKDVQAASDSDGLLLGLAIGGVVGVVLGAIVAGVIISKGAESGVIVVGGSP